jgi:hypothetical protein
VLDPYYVLDLLSILSHFRITSLVVNNTRVFSWLDLAFLRSYIIYVILRHAFSSGPYRTFHIQLLSLFLQVICLIFFASACLFSLQQLGELPGTNSFLFHVYLCPVNATTTATLAQNGKTRGRYYRVGHYSIVPYDNSYKKSVYVHLFLYLYRYIYM